MLKDMPMFHYVIQRKYNSKSNKIE